MTPLEVRRGLIRRRVGGQEAFPAGPLVWTGQFHALAPDEVQSVFDKLDDDPNEEAEGVVACNTCRCLISANVAVDGEGMTASLSAGARW